MNDNRQDISQPKRIKLDYYDEYMRISLQWRGIVSIFLTLLLMVWIYGVVTIGFEILKNSPDGLAIIVVMLFAAVSCSFTYCMLANWLNKTEVFVSHNLMEIKNGPIPWKGNKRLEIGEVEQFYVTTRITGNRDKNVTTHELRCIEKNGTDIKVLEGFGSKQNLQLVKISM